MATETPMTTDANEVSRLSEAFAPAFETLDIDEDAFCPGSFFDNMPVWRFHLPGSDVIDAQLIPEVAGDVRISVRRTVPTTSGFVTGHEQHQYVGGEKTARRLWLCEIRDGRIGEAVASCRGECDEARRVRDAAEAPMIRP